MSSSTRRPSSEYYYDDNPFGSTNLAPKKPPSDNYNGFTYKKPSREYYPFGSTKVTPKKPSSKYNGFTGKKRSRTYNDPACDSVKQKYLNREQDFIRDYHPIYNNGKTYRSEYIKMKRCFGQRV